MNTPIKTSPIQYKPPTDIELAMTPDDEFGLLFFMIIAFAFVVLRFKYGLWGILFAFISLWLTLKSWQGVMKRTFWSILTYIIMGFVFIYIFPASKTIYASTNK